MKRKINPCSHFSLLTKVWMPSTCTTVDYYSYILNNNNQSGVTEKHQFMNVCQVKLKPVFHSVKEKRLFHSDVTALTSTTFNNNER
jgi:hypothetical protein